MIIGLTGKKGSGKDFAGSHLVVNHGFTRISFAEKLKQSAAACFGIKPEAWENWKNDPSALVIIRSGAASEYNHVAISVRQFLQNYGTEAHRDIFGDDFWVWEALGDMSQEKNYVITDCRFDNEATAIKRKGGVIVEIYRGASTEDSHISEGGLSDDLINIVLDNTGEREFLYAQLDTMVESLEWKREWLQ